jgi:hypothetical protein
VLVFLSFEQRTRACSWAHLDFVLGGNEGGAFEVGVSVPMDFFEPKALRNYRAIASKLSASNKSQAGVRIGAVSVPLLAGTY